MAQDRDLRTTMDFGHVIPYEAPMMGFERNISEKLEYLLLWFESNWTWSVWLSVLYVTLVFSGKRFMANREKMDLRGPLAIWSALLAAFSIIGMFRTIPEIVYILKNYGLQSSICNPSFYSGPCLPWMCFFAWSKAFELGDTMFIILRKQSLIFLHWYHHITVMVYCWYTFAGINAPGRWFMNMNYVVHSVMYTYYTLRACRIKIPKIISILITSMQLVQMVMGIMIVTFVFFVKRRGEPCSMTDASMTSCFLMYASYFVLFAVFFKNAYLSPKKTQTAASTSNREATKKTA